MGATMKTQIVPEPFNEIETQYYSPKKSKISKDSHYSINLASDHSLKRSNSPKYSSQEFSSLKKSRFNKKSSKISSSDEPDLLIREYFIAKLSLRAKSRKFTAKYINSIEIVLEILKWSRKKGVPEAYDSAIDLLSECGSILLKVANSDEIEKSNKNHDNIAIQEEWEVLIKGIACAYTLSAQERFNTITKLILTQKTRLVKAAIIDALLMMQDEINPDAIKEHLAYFLSDHEADEYIRDYAQEAYKEI